MRETTDDFEILFDQECAVCDCPLDWEWNGDDLRFEAACECLKKHYLVPKNATMKTPVAEDDDIGLDLEPEWD